MRFLRQPHQSRWIPGRGSACTSVAFVGHARTSACPSASCCSRVSTRLRLSTHALYPAVGIRRRRAPGSPMTPSDIPLTGVGQGRAAAPLPDLSLLPVPCALALSTARSRTSVRCRSFMEFTTETRAALPELSSTLLKFTQIPGLHSPN